MDRKEIIKWLLSGDVSIQYQVHRDLLGVDRDALRNRIAREGWGRRYLSLRKPDGHWGIKYYQPKWTSSHYTLMDLKNLAISPENEKIKATIEIIFQQEKPKNSGILPIGKDQRCDVCLNGMFLNFASYFKTNAEDLRSIIDFILDQNMPDGGFNCEFNRRGAKHSSLHSTLSVLEGITEFKNNGYTYRLEDLSKVKNSSVEFILKHQLFISDRTGKIIHKDFLKLSYPSRWRYDILRALDYFQYAGIPYDDRMDPAIEVLLKKRKKEGTWNLQARHPGKVHFDMEKAGYPSRWNTLRAVRVFKHFNRNIQ